MTAVKIVALLALGFAADWLVMLCVGAAHSQDVRVPALGFWTVWWITLAVGLMFFPRDVARELEK